MGKATKKALVEMWPDTVAVIVFGAHISGVVPFETIVIFMLVWMFIRMGVPDMEDQ